LLKETTMPNLFSRKFYDPGTTTSASAAATILPSQPVTVTMQLDAADLADTSLSIRLAVEANDDPNGNGPWYALISSIWNGGTPSHLGGFASPLLSYSSSVISAARVRGVIDTNKRIRASMDYTVS
jgi:hypothetical protein